MRCAELSNENCSNRNHLKWLLFEGTYFCAPSVGKIDLSLPILRSYALARDTGI